MYLWKTEKLAEQIAADQLTSEVKFQYLIYANILFAISGYFIWYFAVTPTGFSYWFEALMVLIITIGGTLKCKVAFAPVTGLSLIESFFILSLPLSIKMFLFIGIALSLIPWGLELIATSQMLADSSNLESAVTVLNAIYIHHSILVVLFATSWFYWRMKCHLIRIAEEAPNQRTVNKSVQN